MLRRLLLLAFTLALAPALFQATAAAQSDKVPPKCGTKVVFLVWPKGHAATPRIADFPKNPNPTIQLFRGFNSRYKVKAAGAFIVGGTPPKGVDRGGFFSACANYGDIVTKGNVPKPSVTIKNKTAVMCTMPASPVTDLVYRKGGVVDLFVHADGVMLAKGHVTKSSATLTVVSGRCKLAASPG